MKKIIYVFLAIGLLIAPACKKDAREIILRNDGDPNTSPNLPEDIYEAATQFSATEVSSYSGKLLTAVNYYMIDTPLSTKLKIYGEGDGARPGDLLYEGSLTGGITTNEWSTHVLSSPLTLTGEEIWISIEMRLTKTQQSIGCDRGPAVSGGDWLFQESDGVWRAFQVRYGESINWNIRGVIED